MERNCRSNLRPQLGAGWERRWIGASIWIFIHGRRLHLGSAFYGLPRTPWGTFCYLPTPPPCWESVFSGKPAHGHTVWTDCAARTFETSSANLDAPGHTEPSADSAASALRLGLIQFLQLTRVSKQRPQIRGLRGKEPGENWTSPVARPSSWTRLVAASSVITTSLQASGRSGGTSRRAPDWNPLANLCEPP